MTQVENFSTALVDGKWPSIAELVEAVGHRFSATIHHAVK